MTQLLIWLGSESNSWISLGKGPKGPWHPITRNLQLSSAGRAACCRCAGKIIESVHGELKKTDGSETSLELAKGLQPKHKDVDQEKSLCQGQLDVNSCCLSSVNITSLDRNITSIMVLLSPYAVHFGAENFSG